ncbi:hypothetical protein BDA96_06G069900 [Sorghum bicolor]|uniref:RNA-binding protein Tab2/Atab2 C-terminal domain-containing protein n=1 Tax=Sorghum bicolor TaxID=4558 RepID=A0A921QP05_SORBI|nr:hypothetical protein BDA96_06G069900 [Sorghum bicolor]
MWRLCPCPWPTPPPAPHSAAASTRTAAAAPHPARPPLCLACIYATYELLLSPDRIELLLSGRSVSLLLWLEKRYEVVYSRHPEFQAGTRPLLALDNPFPTTLPENLFGDKWAFVQLPFSAIDEAFWCEVESLGRRYGAGLGSAGVRA